MKGKILIVEILFDNQKEHFLITENNLFYERWRIILAFQEALFDVHFHQLIVCLLELMLSSWENILVPEVNLAILSGWISMGGWRRPRGSFGFMCILTFLKKKQDLYWHQINWWQLLKSEFGVCTFLADSDSDLEYFPSKGKILIVEPFSVFTRDISEIRPPSVPILIRTCESHSQADSATRDDKQFWCSLPA